MSILCSDLIKTLKFYRIKVKATIIPVDSNQIIISSNDEDELQIETSGSSLLIQAKMDEKNVSSNYNFNGVTIIGNGNITISNSFGTTVINNEVVSSNNKTFEMTIEVPRNQIRKLDLSGSTNINVKGISEKLVVDTSGQSTVLINNVYEVIIDSSGQSNVEIIDAKVVNLDTSGQSDIKIDNNVLESLIIDTSGNSNIRVNGDVIDLDIDSSGISNITIHGKVKYQNVNKSGISNINIRG